MKKLILLIILVFVGSAGWRIGNQLSSDAISMAVGIFFGVLAGIPTALLVLASERHKGERAARATAQHGLAHPQPYYTGQGTPSQPPVIILNGAASSLPQGSSRNRGAYLTDTGQGDATYPMPGWSPAEWPVAQPGQRPSRRFKVVGEQEAWLE